MRKTHRFKIVLMAEHFLYLPLYYACDNSFFHKLPAGYSLELTTAHPKTDAQAYRQLMDISSDQYRDIVFAVCDPTVVLTVNAISGASAAVLARLVTNAAFWAIDHKSRRVQLLRDLGEFDKVISFHPGSTSYAIAQRVFREAGREPSILCVDPQQELSKLVESPPNWTALSPDLLEIEHLISNDTRFDIDLALGKTPEYNDVLVTALISRADLVQEHADLVIGLLEAIQTALLIVNSHDPELSRRVTGWASSRFQEPMDVVDRALIKAREAQLFPMTVDINEPDWLNAARTVPEARGEQFDSAFAKRAKDVFTTHVDPYRGLAKKAISTTFVPSPKRKPQPLYFAFGGLAMGLVIASIIRKIGLFSQIPSGIYVPLLIALLVIGVVPHLVERTKKDLKVLIPHWLFVIIIGVTVTLWHTKVIDSVDAIAIAAAFSGPFAGFWVDRLSRISE
jgi:hypothetical protein